MGLKGSRLEEKTRFYAFNESTFASILLASSSQPSLQSLPMGQLCVLHTSDIVPSPMQSFPPYLGAGSEQRRFLLWTPPSQVTVQVFQGDQGPQPPSTKGNNNEIISQRPVLNSRMQRVALEIQLTGTGRHLADFSLPSFSLAVHATHLWRGRVAEAYPGDVSLTAGHRAGRPG